MSSNTKRTGTWDAYAQDISSTAKSKFDSQAFPHPHKLTFLRPIPASGHTRFANYLALYFPEVMEIMDEVDWGVLHLEVGALKLATRDAIVNRDWATVAMHFAFVDSMLEGAERELHDAIRVSYLGNLFYSEASLNYAKARTLLPPRLFVALKMVERHYETLQHGSNK